MYVSPAGTTAKGTLSMLGTSMCHSDSARGLRPRPVKRGTPAPGESGRRPRKQVYPSMTICVFSGSDL